MRTKSFPSSAAVALVMGLAVLAAPWKIEAQQTPSDRFDIALSHPVTIDNKVLPPGNYSLEPLDIAGGRTPVLSISLINPDHSMKFETVVKIVPTVETFNFIQPETRVFLRHIGQRYYFDRIWVKGHEYGYNFPPPKGVKGQGSVVE